jgi:hypothetical protein
MGLHSVLSVKLHLAPLDDGTQTRNSHLTGEVTICSRFDIVRIGREYYDWRFCYYIQIIMK